MCPSLSRVVLALLCVWTYLCRGQCALPRTDASSERRSVDTRREDTLREHMQLLYDKYTRAGFSLRDGNTVRSFKAHRGSVDRKQLQLFNLTSLTQSEDVLSATLHFHVTDLHHVTRGRRGRGGGPRGHTHVHVVMWSFGSVDDEPRTLGQFHVNVSTRHRGGASWQWKDVTRALDDAKRRGELLVGVVVKTEPPSPHSPYILVYANDSSISEPEKVVAALRRRRAVGGDSLGSAPHSFLRLGERGRNQTRRRRSVDVLLPLQNNELPGPEYPYETAGWDQSGPQDKGGRRPRKKTTRQNKRPKVPLLQFDQRTINKARKKQWEEPRNCARRHLKVDFADIGWSEWIISPESFEAFYCSGSCQFPMPKSLKPSNHATIQSIVRAVGVVSGIPEPCCVPDKMSSLSILFFDEDKNVVLKVYPNMTVDSCACR